MRWYATAILSAVSTASERELAASLGERKDLRMPHLERGAVVELLHLPRHGLRDPRMAVAERAAPHARDAIEEALALGGRVVRALGARKDSRPGVFLEVAVVGEGHPVGPGPEARGLAHDCSFVFHEAPHTLSGRELTLVPRNWNERCG